MVGRSPRRGPALVDVVRMPHQRRRPSVLLLRRLLLAAGVLLAGALVMYLDRDGYADLYGDATITFGDAIYYSSVSLSTTGYGDVVPVSPQARLLTTLVITPLRVLFVIILVESTLGVLTEEYRRAVRIGRWRKRVRDHTVVVGAGTQGRAAVETLISDGIRVDDIVVVDTDRERLNAIAAHGLVTITGDATKSRVLRLAMVERARAVVVATNRDDTAALVTLTARSLAADVRVVAGVRETDNAHLVRQSGADTVVIAQATAGRLLGVATSTPAAIDVVEELLAPSGRLGIGQRPITPGEVGLRPAELPETVLGVVRDGRAHSVGEEEITTLRPGDQVVHVRGVSPTRGGRPAARG